MDLKTDIINLKGIGEKSANLFHKLNIFNAKDLLGYFPRDYETFQEPLAVCQTKAGELCAVKALVCGAPAVKKIRNLTILTLTVKDATGAMQLTFFNMPYLKSILKSGQVYIFRGVVQEKGITKYMEQPRMYKEEEYRSLQAFIQPRYGLTKGLTNLSVVKAVKQVLSLCPIGEEHLPEEILEKYDMPGYEEALHGIHFPENYEQLVKARKRLAFDEFFCFMVMLRKSRELAQAEKNHFPMLETAETIRLLQSLPYRLTPAQMKVWEEIKEDMCGGYCMNRLIQGDVGAGKTIVALLALLMCAANGYQGAMMAPTEVLARQHYESVKDLAEKYMLPLRPVLLVGSMTAKEKRLAYEEIACGSANLVLGTHAVIQEKVVFSNLALVVTDEQHRFGVRQREMLAGKGDVPHILVMSATPIPRTLAIILYGDLHLSVIDELPAGRLPIKNCVVGTSYRPTAYKFIAGEAAKGRQIYVICPMVEEGETEGLENVTDYTEKLKNLLPPQLQVACLHGKMRPADKNRIMEAFAARDIDVLVSTTVIEVGINVPNATVMLVENAERFGLAQLHQLRGRVGRGREQSYCIFISSNEKPETMKRLEILNTSNDGFHIAEEDLKLRGPGDLFGIRQSGDLEFRIGDIYNDADVLKAASECAEAVLQEDFFLSGEKYRALKEYLTEGAMNVVDFKSI